MRLQTIMQAYHYGLITWSEANELVRHEVWRCYAHDLLNKQQFIQAIIRGAG